MLEGEVFGVPGPNGAGKTSMFHLLTGVYKPDAGQIFFRDQDITYMPAVPPDFGSFKRRAGSPRLRPLLFTARLAL